MESDVSVVSEQGKSSKKRKCYGRISDASKKMRAQAHETGDNCKCSKLKCFSNITQCERWQIISHFNNLPDRDTQNLHLSGLIESSLVKQRYKRNENEDSRLHSYCYKYKVRVTRNDHLHEQQVCYKAFLALHGITGRRLQTIQEQLAHHGKVLPDLRGKHSNRPHALTDNTKSKIHEYLQSLRGRKSHYSLGKSDKIYLPEELNVKKLHELYTEKNPENPVSYHSFLKIFESEYNFGFGYPRSDTCSKCDEFKAKKQILSLELSKTSTPEKLQELGKQLKTLETELEFHQRKAATFYERKRSCRQLCSKKVDHEAVTMDYQKNLPVPNISTNVVYYKRQLTVQLFNIHVLSTGDSYFFSYDQTVAKKGANDVTSMLHEYILNFLSPEVKFLYVFCDSCGGQNKNNTLIRYLHYVVHKIKRLYSITVTFPERGHSYMECDRNMALIPKRKAAELPQDWYEAIRGARAKPSPFMVIECEQSMFKDWTKFFNTVGYYKKKLPVPIRPIKELKIEEIHPRTISLRTTYNGHWQSSVITERESSQGLQPGEFFYPDEAYQGRIPVPRAKWKDLQVTLILFLKYICKMF